MRKPYLFLAGFFFTSAVLPQTLRETKHINAPLTVSFAKRTLQGFDMRMWISNQMTSGLQAWDASDGNSIPVSPHFGLEYPTGSGIEHLFGGGPWLGGIIDGVPRVSEGYNPYDARKELLPGTGDTVRNQIWRTSVQAFGEPNKRGVDDDGDGKIDEDFLDGWDNDGDWNPATDDVGMDGIPDSLEVGCKGGYDPIFNPDPAFDNYTPTRLDTCHAVQIGYYRFMSDKTLYTEHNGVPDHGEPHVDEDYGAVSEMDFSCSATDTFHTPVVSGHVPMGVVVTQKSYAWMPGSSTKAFIIMDYIFVNSSRNSWDSTYVGYAADFDVGPVNVSGYMSHNLAAYDSASHTAYVRNPIDRGSTPAGVALLGSSKSFDSLNMIFKWADYISQPGPGTVDADLYKWMSCDGGTGPFIDPPQSSSSDTRVYVGVGPFQVKPGDTVEVTFAILAGTNVSDLLNNAALAQSVYDFYSPTSVREFARDMPAQFHLMQNYPNPFNPSTHIDYSLSKTAYVTLQIYDVLGRAIATLVNERKQAGSYAVQWDASGFPSGLYFYRLVTGDGIETKKMILIQ